MNKYGEKVNRAQFRENVRCLREYQRDKLSGPMAFDSCITADEKGRVRRAAERTVTREQKKCDPLAVPPPFAYTDAATVNTAAVNAALWMNYVIFGGPPVDDNILVTRAENRSTAKCQLEMLKRGDRLENVVLKEINKAKRKAIKDVTVDSGAALKAKLQTVFSSNAKINKARDRFVRRVDRKCAALQAVDMIFPGACGKGAANLGEIKACVIAATRCEACLKIKAFDNLNLDCDQADDQDNANGSCP
jgi:hypothetical protein